MNKRSKILAGLVVGAMALGVMCLGFASWSTDIEAGGSVSAEGSWDVAVTAADMEVSTGASITPLSATENTVEVTVYDVYIGYYSSRYYLQTDLSSARTIEVSLADIQDYNIYYAASTTSQYFYGDTVSDVANGYILNVADEYVDNVPVKDATIDLGIVTATRHASSPSYTGYLSTSDPGKAMAAANGELVGTAICVKTTTSFTYTEEWTNAINVLSAEGEAVNVEFDDTTVTYGAVSFSLPQAWANYSVTVTNNGSVNANLGNYSFDVDGLDSDVYTISLPEGFDDEVLAPGESCTFNFVVQLTDTTDTSVLAEDASFSVTLKYVQDAVEEAPSAGHTNA